MTSYGMIYMQMVFTFIICIHVYDIMNSPNGSQIFIPKQILKCLWVVDYKYATL